MIVVRFKVKCQPDKTQEAISAFRTSLPPAETSTASSILISQET